MWRIMGLEGESFHFTEWRLRDYRRCGMANGRVWKWTKILGEREGKPVEFIAVFANGGQRQAGSNSEMRSSGVHIRVEEFLKPMLMWTHGDHLI